MTVHGFAAKGKDMTEANTTDGKKALSVDPYTPLSKYCCGYKLSCFVAMLNRTQFKLEGLKFSFQRGLNNSVS